MDPFGEYAAAWAAWLAGRPAAGQLWGVPMLWWGRTGKIVEFLAGLTVVLDLVGPEPLRRLGRRLSPWTWPRVTGAVTAIFGTAALIGWALGFLMALLTWNLLWGVLSHAVFDRGEPPVEGDLPQVFYEPLVVVTALAVWVVFSVAGALIDKRVDFLAERKHGFHYFVFQAPGLSIGVILAGLVLAPVFVPLAVLVVPAFQVTAWLLERDRPEYLLKWLALVVFTIGFHFDLLAS